MATNNSTILAHAWLLGNNDFQQRIPDPTQSGISATVDALLDPMNKVYFNQFMDILIMRIGDTFVHQQSFRNPLAVFKKSKMMYGSTMQEIVPKWIRAHAYVDDAEDVFKMARPDVAQWFHSQNRRDRYDITINRDELRSAFTEEGGLNRLVAAILDVPMNSDEYDEYRIMLQLIAEYENSWGFYKEHVSAITDESTAKAFLKKLRTFAGKLQFPNTIYNNGAVPDVPIFVKPSELVLFITPEIQASIDVDALAVLFHLEKAEVQQRTIVVDEFPIPNVQALLTTQDFFMCRDTEYTTTSAWNPKTLGNNYFLHHWGIYSVSPFVPAILFTTEEGTSIDQAYQVIESFTLTSPNSTVYVGEEVQLTVALIGYYENDFHTLSDANQGLLSQPAVPHSAATFETHVSRANVVDAVQGIYKVVVGGTWVANDTVTVDGTVVTVASGSTATTAVATAIKNAITASNPHYTATVSGSTVTLTEKSAFSGIGQPTASKNSTSGTVSVSTYKAGDSGVRSVNSPRTYVDCDNVLHVGDDLRENDHLTIIAHSAYVNPGGANDPELSLTARLDLTVIPAV